MMGPGFRLRDGQAVERWQGEAGAYLVLPECHLSVCACACACVRVYGDLIHAPIFFGRVKYIDLVSLVTIAFQARVLFISGLLSFLAMGVSIAALYVDRDHTYPDASWTPEYWIMVIALCLWGVFAGVYYPAMTAILADSVETGNRTSLYTYRWALQMVTRGMGPLTAAVLFHYWTPNGDSWKLENVRDVFLAGMIATSLPAVLLFFYDDNATLGRQSEAVVQTSKDNRRIAEKGVRPDEARPLINSTNARDSELVQHGTSSTTASQSQMD